MFRPKALRFGRNKNISAEYSVSAEFRFLRMACFGFRCFGKKSVSVGHYGDHADDVGEDEGGVAAHAVGEEPEAEVADGAAQEEHGLREGRDPVLVTDPVELWGKMFMSMRSCV